MTYLLLDTETTGIDVNTSDIIQVAWCVVDAKGVPVTAVKSSFTNTTDTVPPGASAVNHIIIEDLVGAPSIDSVLALIEADCIQHNVKAMVCHNLPFDGSMLMNYSVPEVMGNLDGVCSLKLSRYLWPDSESHALQYLRYSLPLKVARDIVPHKADTDVLVLGVLFAAILSKLPNYKDIIKICDSPVYIKRMPFGKHKGRLLVELPSSYIQWLLKLTDLDADLQWSLRGLLHRK